MKRARWWMRRRWYPRTFAEYMATPEKIQLRDMLLAMCDAAQVDSPMRATSSRKARRA